MIEALADDLTPDAIAAMRSAGVTEEAIEDAIAASATFHIVDRLADSFDFALPGDEGNAAAAKVLLRLGYSMPPPVWWFAG